MSRHAPVIVIGMHRSGTSAVVRALDELGLFTGHDLEPNAEARFFLRLNEQMLRMAGAYWDSPEPMLQLLEDDELVEWLARWLDLQLHGFGTSLYLSKPGWVRYRDIRRYPQPWGWKDPRNTLTLPVWLRLFPDAKVVNVVRHGVDVAASLQFREEKLRYETLHTSQYEPKAWRVTSLRCRELKGAFSLWEDYVSAADSALVSLSVSQKLQFRFEDWLQSPLPLLQQLNEWLGLGASEARMQSVANDLRPERGFAYRGSEQLNHFDAEVASHSALMRKYYLDDGNSR